MKEPWTEHPGRGSAGRNIPLFIAFRVLFNARFYYPVIGILFLDLGLTLEQYALLNVVWAISIILLEIPSGALADAIGRKRMVVLAGGLMVCELGIFAFAPTENPALLFGLLICNRILSGAAEAAASGADEALAYDSLPEKNRAEAWPRVLESLMRWQSGAFFVVMLSGAALFDAQFLQSGAAVFGIAWSPDPSQTVRWPVIATFGMSILCFLSACAMREPGDRNPDAAHGSGGLNREIRKALQNVALGFRCIVDDRRILLLILAALIGDSVIRLFLTFASNYYRLIELPEVANGILGAAMALIGFLAAPLARRLVARFSAPVNLLIAGSCAFVGLLGAAAATPIFGVWVILPIQLSMAFLGFFVATYLNAWADTRVRATVLSFRGVALNFGYGSVGIAFAAMTGQIRSGSPDADENEVFATALFGLPSGFLIAATVLAVFAYFGRPDRKPSGREQIS